MYVTLSCIFVAENLAAEDLAYTYTKRGRLQCNTFDLMSNSLDL